MNQSIIFYNQANEKLVSLPIRWENEQGVILEKEKLAEIALNNKIDLDQVTKIITPDTFTIAFNEEKATSMSYNQWETLRSQQANDAIQEKIGESTLEQPIKNQIANLFNDFNQGMAVKYQGKKSWNAIYEELLANIEQLLK